MDVLAFAFRILRKYLDLNYQHVTSTCVQQVSYINDSIAYISVDAALVVNSQVVNKILN